MPQLTHPKIQRIASRSPDGALGPTRIRIPNDPYTAEICSGCRALVDLDGSGCMCPGKTETAA